MMNFREIAGCCGAAELFDLSTFYTSASSELQFSHLPFHRYVIWLFTDAVAERNGSRLAKWITDNNYGEVISFPRGVLNPNSGNNINAWLWKPNQNFKRKVCRE